VPGFAVLAVDYSDGIVAKLIFGGKDKTGGGAPEGLPLNFRFSLHPHLPLSYWEMSQDEGKIISILRWRTLVLVIHSFYILLLNNWIMRCLSHAKLALHLLT